MRIICCAWRNSTNDRVAFAENSRPNGFGLRISCSLPVDNLGRPVRPKAGRSNATALEPRMAAKGFSTFCQENKDAPNPCRSTAGTPTFFAAIAPFSVSELVSADSSSAISKCLEYENNMSLGEQNNWPMAKNKNSSSRNSIQHRVLQNTKCAGILLDNMTWSSPQEILSYFSSNSLIIAKK